MGGVLLGIAVTAVAMMLPNPILIIVGIIILCVTACGAFYEY